MKKNKKESPRKLTSAQLKALSIEVASKYDEFLEGLDENLKENITSNINDHSDLLDVYDQLILIKEYLISKTDDRPQPLDFSKSHGHQSDLIGKVNEETQAFMKKDNLRLREWATCSGPGYKNEKASLGNIDFNLEELAIVRDWIDSVIKWHQKNPSRRKE